MKNKLKGMKGLTAIGVGLLIFTLIFFSVSYILPVFAANNVIVKGDLPDDSTTYVIRAYEGPSSDPCPGSGANLLATTTASALAGDPANDNNDYQLNISSVSDLYIYYCQGVGSGDLRLSYHKGAVSSDTTYYIDLGKVVGTSLHPDLNGDRVIICNGLDGTELSSERFDWNKVSGGSYTQFYAIDQGTSGNPVVGNAYVLFDTDVDSATCTFDSTIETGKIITLNSLSEKYGVYVTFAPETKAIGDLHDDFDNDWLKVDDSNGINIGLTYVSDGDCWDDGDDNHILYYDNPPSGTIRMTLYTLSSTYPTTIEWLSNGFTSQDAVVKIYGTVPTDITRVEISHGTLTYKTNPDGNGNYNLYVKDNFVGTIRFFKGANEVFTKSLTILDTTSTTCANHDIHLDLAKYYGTAHNDLRDGAGGYIIEVYSDSNFTTKISDSNHPGDPDGSGYYEVYFDVTAGPNLQTYVKIDGTTYDTEVFGDLASAGEQIQFNPEDKLSGTVPTDITLIETDIDQDGTEWEQFKDARTTDDTNGIYKLYSDFSGSIKIEFETSVSSPNPVLVRTKTFASDVQLDVAKLTGCIDGAFANSDAYNMIAVYDSRNNLTETLDDANDFVDDNNVAICNGDDLYYVYFEVTSTVTDGIVDVKFDPITDTDGITWRMEVDKDPSNSNLDALGGGDVENIDLIYTMSGTIHADIVEIWLKHTTGWRPVIVETATSGSLKVYKMYFDGLSESSGSWHYEAHISGDTKVLDRDQAVTNTANLDGDFFDVGKLKGETHTNLETGDDTIEVWNNFDCNNQMLSSEVVHPADNAVDDYKQYFELVPHGNLGAYYIKATMVSSEYSSRGNPFMLTEATYEAIMNLVVEKTGVAPTTIMRVGLDKDQNNADDVYTIDFSSLPTGKGYHVFTTPDTDINAWVHYYTDTGGVNKVLTLVDDLSTAGTHVNNVGSISGQVPGDSANSPPQLHGGTVYAYLTQGKACGSLSADESSAPIVDGGAVDNYTIYMKANTNYYLVFCDSGGNKRYETFGQKSVSPGEQGTLNLAMIKGEMDSNFATGPNARIEVYDNFNVQQVGTTERSVGDGNGITANENGGSDDYFVYFEQSGTKAATLTDEGVRKEPDIVADVALKIIDNSGYVSWEIGIEKVDGITPFAPGDVKVVDLNLDINGDVPTDVDYVIVEDMSNEYAIGEVKADGTYQIYTRANPGDRISLEETTHTPAKVLTRSKTIADDITFYAAKLASTIHSSFTSANGDMMQVYDDWANSSTLLSSISYVTDGGLGDDSYEVYFEDTAAVSNVDLKMTDSNGKVSWRLNVDENNTNGNTLDAINEDGQTITDLALTNTLTGLTPAGITSIRISEYTGGGAFVYTLAVGVTSGSDGYIYKMYFDDEANAAGNSWYLEAYSNPLELKRQKVVNGNTNTLPVTFNVARVQGDTHSNLNDGTNLDDIQVRNIANLLGSGALLSSEPEQPLAAKTPDYTQYFEHDDSSYFLIHAKDVEGGTTYNSYAKFSVAAGYTATVDLTYLLGGKTPSCEPGFAIWADDDATRGDDHPEYAASPTGNTYRLYHPYPPTDTTNFWLRFDLDADYTNNNILFRDGGTMSLERQHTLGQYSSTGWNIALVKGASHANLNEADNDDIQVYTRSAANQPHELGTLQSSELSNITAGSYQQFFEQTQSAAANYVMNITDRATGVVYESYHRISTTTYGDCVTQDLDALKYGTVTEECAGNRQADVLITLLDSTGTNVLSTTETYWDGTFWNDGTYRIYTDGPGTYDIKYEKPVFITNYLNDETLNVGDNLNDVTLQYTVRINVYDQYGYPITNADVTMINVSNVATMKPVCENGQGSYFIPADPTLYPLVDFRIEKLWYESEFDDNGGNHYQVSNLWQLNNWYDLDLEKNAVQMKITSPADGINLRGVVQVSAAEFSKYDETVLNDSFEDGNIYGWQSTGFWHITNRRAKTGSFSWWYGQEATGNYDNGTQNSGELITKSIDLTGLNDATLTFQTWWKIEKDDPVNYDLMRVYVSIDEGSTWTEILKLNPTTNPGCSNFYGSGGCDNAVWVQKSVDLTPYVRNRILIKFNFDTIDADYNNYEGWYIDDVKITSSANVFDNVTFQYALADGTISESDWVTISVDTSAPWSVNWDTTSLADGIYELRVIGRDIHYGLVGEDYVTDLVIDNTPPIIQGLQWPNYIKNGNTVTLFINTDATGYTVTADFSALDSGFVRGSEHVQDNGDTTYKLSYTVTHNNAISDGQKTIPVIVKDKAGNSNTANAYIILDNTLPAVTFTNPSPNAFVSGTIDVQFSISDTNLVASTARLSLDNGNTWVTPTCASGTCSYSWDTSSLPDGMAYELIAKVSDKAGNEGIAERIVIVDNGAPESVVITYPYRNQYLTQTTEIEAVTADSVTGTSSVEFQYYDGSWNTISTDTSAPWTASFAACSYPSATKLRAIATDGLGTQLTSTEVPIIVDCTPPSITVNPVSGVVSGYVTVSTSGVSTDVVSVQFEIATVYYPFCYDVSPPFTCRLDTRMVSDGLHTIRAIAIDRAGLTTISSGVEITIDNTPPVVTITSPANNQFVKGIVPITFTMSDANINYASAEISTDGGQTWTNAGCTASPCTYNWNTATAINGMAYGLQVRVSDTANPANTGYSEMTTVIVDNTAMASMVVVLPLSNSIVSGITPIEAVASDAFSGTQYVEFYVDGNYEDTDDNYADGWRINWNSTNVNDGVHSVYVIGYDNVGNSRQSNEVSFIVDNNPPSTPTSLEHIEDPVAGYDYDRDGIITWYWYPAIDEGSGIDHYMIYVNDLDPIVVYGTQNQEGWLTYTISDLYDNYYKICVSAVDKVGYESDCSDYDNVIVDTIPPTDLAISINNNAQYTSSAIVTLTLTYLSDAYQCSYSNDTQSWSSWETPTTTKSWTLSSGDGTKIVFFKCKDEAGNEGQIVYDTIILDTQSPPAPTLLFPVNGSYMNNPYVTYTWDSVADESGISGYNIERQQVTGGNNFRENTINPPATFTETSPLPDGMWKWRVKAQDKATNWGSYSDWKYFTVDTVAPTLSNAGPTGTLNTGSVILAVDTNEQALCRYSTSNVGFDAMGNSFTAVGNQHRASIFLPDGTYTYYYRCKDLAGNEAGTSVAFTIATTAPIVTSTSPWGYVNVKPSYIVVKTNVDATCRWDTNDKTFNEMPSGNEFTTTANIPKNVNISSSSLIEGGNAIYVRCKDAQGNMMSSSAVVVFTIDTVPPTIISVGPTSVQGSNVVIWAKTNENAYCRYGYSPNGYDSLPYQFTDGEGTTYHRRNIGPLTDGAKIIYISCRDLAGNSMTNYEELKFIVDTSNPSIGECSLSKPMISYYVPNTVNNSVDITCSISDSAGIENVKAYVIGSNGNIIKSIPLNNAGSGTIYGNDIGIDGVYTIKVNVTDIAGKTVAVNLGQLKVDGTPPRTLQVKVKSINATEVVLIAAIEDYARFSNITAIEYFVSKMGEDGTSPYNSWNSSYIITDGLDDTFENVTIYVPKSLWNGFIFVHAMDAAGNWERTEALYLESREGASAIPASEASKLGIQMPTGLVTSAYPITEISIFSAIIAVIIAVGLLFKFGVFKTLTKK